MYDAPWSDDPHSYYSDHHSDNRLTYLVMVDGRLVDFWNESVRGSRFADFADQFDRERQPVTQAPPTPAYDLILGWLRGLVGGAQPLDELRSGPLEALAPMDVESLPLGHRHRLEGIGMALEALPRLDPEFEIALANAVKLVWKAESSALLNAASAGQAAGALAWAVGKANGQLSPEGTLRQKDISAALGIKPGLSGPGRRIQAALVGPPSLLGTRPYGLGCPDLLGLGSPSLLTGETRRRLIRLRDHAIRARDAQAA